MNLGNARAAIEQALPECCAEVLAWRKTGVLTGINLRVIADNFVDGDLQITEDEVVKQALSFAVKFRQQ